MTDFRIRVIVDPGPAVVGAKAVEGQLKKTQGAADGLQATLFKTFAAVGITVGIGKSIRLLADYSQAMSTVQAVTGATAEQFAELDARAQDLGRNTRFTATEAAEGMKLLAQAGFTAEEALVAVEGTLKLAQAGGLGLADAADVASSSLRGFRLDVSETGRVVDVLAKAANASNTNVQQLGEGLKFVAPVAAGLGVSIEEVVASMGKLSDAGLQASLAGTGLRRVLSELESPSTKTTQILSDLGVNTEDVIISQVGLTAALTRLRDAGITTGQALELFGDRGGPAFEVLSSQIPAVVELTDTLRNAGGTADRVAEIMDDNLNGALLRVVSAFEGLILAAGSAGGLTALTTAANGLAVGINFLTDNIDALAVALGVLGVGLLLTKTALIANTVAGLSAVGAYVAQTVAATALTFSLGGLSSVALGAAAALKAVAFTNPFTLVVVGAAAAFVAVKELTKGIEEYQAALKIAEEGELGGLSDFGKLGAQIIKAEQGIAKYKKSLDEGRISQEQYDIVAGNLIRKVGILREQQDKLAASTKKAKDAAAEQREEADKLNLAFERSKKALAEEARLLGFVGQEREDQARLSQLLASIQEEGGPELTSKQQEELLAIIKKNEALQATADAYDSVKGPQEEFLTRVSSLQGLLDANKITTDEFNKAIADLAQNADDLDLTSLKLPEGSTVDLTGTLERIRAEIEAEEARQAVESQRKQIITDLIPPLDLLTQRQALVNQLRAEGAIGDAAAATETERINEEIKKLNPEYKLQTEYIQSIVEAQAGFILKQEALAKAFMDGTINLQTYNAELDKLKEKSEVAGTGFGDGFTAGLKRIESQVGTTADQVEGLMVGAFNSAADALTEFVTTGELDFKKFASSIVQQITKIIIQELLLQAIRGISGAGAAPGVTGSASGGEFGAGDRMIVGEKGPEMVSFNQPGVVTPANQTSQLMENMGGGGGGTTVVASPPPQVNVSIVNVDDPNAARDAMRGEEGAELIMNQVRKNKTALKRELQ